MRLWMQVEGKKYKTHSPGSGPNYMSHPSAPMAPFSENPSFISERVLSEEAREMIWEKIMRQGESIKAVSAELGVDMRRVAAVVRLKEVEKDWVAKVGICSRFRFPQQTGTPISPYSPMMITIHSISLEDMQHMVTYLALRASLRRVTLSVFIFLVYLTLDTLD